MSTTNLLAKEIFSFGFKNAKKHFWSFFLFFIVYFAISLIPILNILGIIYLMFSFYSAIIKISRGEEVTLKTFFTWPKNGFKALWAYIASSLVTIPIFLIAYLPLLLLTKPITQNVTTTMSILSLSLVIVGSVVSIYVSLRLYFAMFYSLETGSWAIASIKKSWEITQGRVGRIIVLGIISTGIVILGVLVIMIGLLWAMPTVIIAYVYIYTKLLPNNIDMNHTDSNIIVQPTEIPANNQEMVENNT